MQLMMKIKKFVILSSILVKLKLIFNTNVSLNSEQKTWTKEDWNKVDYYVKDSNVDLEEFLKVCLTQRGMLPLKDEKILVYSDGVSHKLWQSQRDAWHPILLHNSQDVWISKFVTA